MMRSTRPRGASTPSYSTRLMCGRGVTHSQPFEELERLEFEMRRAIAPAMPQRQPHRTLAVHFQPILRQQGPQRVPTQPLKPERMRKERRSAGATAFERCGES